MKLRALVRQVGAGPVSNYRITPPEKSPTADNLPVKIRPARRLPGRDGFLPVNCRPGGNFSRGGGRSYNGETFLWGRWYFNKGETYQIRDYLSLGKFFMRRHFNVTPARAGQCDNAMTSWSHYVVVFSAHHVRHLAPDCSAILITRADIFETAPTDPETDTAALADGKVGARRRQRWQLVTVATTCEHRLAAIPHHSRCAATFVRSPYAISLHFTKNYVILHQRYLPALRSNSSRHNNWMIRNVACHKVIINRIFTR